MNIYQSGVRCVSCGKDISVPAYAISAMSDTWRATCAFCLHTATYKKTDIHLLDGSRPIPKKLGWLMMALVLGGMLVLLLALKP